MLHRKSDEHEEEVQQTKAKAKTHTIKDAKHDARSRHFNEAKSILIQIADRASGGRRRCMASDAAPVALQNLRVQLIMSPAIVVPDRPGHDIARVHASREGRRQALPKLIGSRYRLAVMAVEFLRGR